MVVFSLLNSPACVFVCVLTENDSGCFQLAQFTSLCFYSTILLYNIYIYIILYIYNYIKLTIYYILLITSVTLLMLKSEFLKNCVKNMTYELTLPVVILFMDT